MISILLIILKIIGITLLVIIGLLLLGMLIVLFVPVRYCIKGRYEESLYLKGRVTWLLHLLSVRVEVGKETVTTVKILGIPLSKLINNKQKKRDAEPVTEVKKKKDLEPVAEVKKKKDLEPVAEVEKKIDLEPAAGVIAGKDISGETIKKDVSLYQKIRSKISDLHDKIKTIIKKIKIFWHNVEYRKKQIQRFLGILRSDTCKAAFSLCKKRMGKVLKHLFPQKLHADLTFGFEDPATTGYLLAVYGMLPEYVGKNIILRPDFDNALFKGTFSVKGRVRAATLLYQAACIFFDGNCRKLYHIVKKEIVNEHE